MAEPTPANSFLIGKSRWARVIELIEAGLGPRDIAARMEMDLQTVMAIRNDYLGLVE